MDHPTDPDGLSIRWLSYEELGRLRGISTASATRLAFRRRWRRQKGNDGTARVAVPVSEIAPRKRPEAPASPGAPPAEDMLGMLRAAREWLVAARAARDRAEQELELERETRITAEAEREHAEAERDQAQAELIGLRAGMEALQRQKEALEAQVQHLGAEGRRAREESARLAERLVQAQLAERELAAATARLERLRRRGLLARIFNREA